MGFHKKLNYDFLDCAKKMPPLKHGMGDDEFDIMNSDVAAWLMNQPEIRQKIFNMAVNKKLIVFSPKTRKWQGVDHADKEWSQEF